MPDTIPGHERLAKRRAEAARVLLEASIRLMEVLQRRHADVPRLDDELLADAAYVLGIEGDGDDEEETHAVD